MGNFMRAYTIAFETDNGERVASRSIVSFFKRVEEILEESPENVIRRINGKLMRVHAYEWNHMNDNYVVVPIGKLKEKNRPYGSDPETQKLIDIPQEMFDVNSIAYHKHRLTMVNTPLNRALGVRNQIFHSNDTRSAVAWTWERMMSATCRRSSKSMLSQFPRWEDRYSIFCGETLSAFSAAISFISP